MKPTDKSGPQSDSATITEQESSELSNVDSNPENSANQEEGGYENKTEPTRYGDWEIAGRCIDF